ncbi:hypothetical protein WMW72_25360 [Paenibacillus filicis]|uniref:C1q domain-containing protein n=1 Tax=Paenibacillus filicis TaxID=669464 RepID=A0ABU9DQU5_9BACL
MQTTPNLGLKKPEGTDVVDIADLNGNMDTLDAEVVKKASASADGRMSKEDFAKLAGIAAGANNYVHPATHPASVIVQDANNRFVTDAEKAGWNAKASAAPATTSAAGLMSAPDKSKLDNAVPTKTTADITYYVRTDGNDNNTGLANSASGAFKTIAKAFSLVPMILNHNVDIVLGTGTFAEGVSITGFSGSGRILLRGGPGGVLSDNFIVSKISITRCACPIVLDGIKISTSTEVGIEVTYVQTALINNCKMDSSAPNATGILVTSSFARVYNAMISNRLVAISSYFNGYTVVDFAGGTGNVYSLRADNGVVMCSNSKPVSTNGDITLTAGQILNTAVTNPWGDNTWGMRPAARAIGSLDTQQVIAPNTWTKVQFPQKNYDNLGNYDSSIHRFTAPQNGIYLINTIVLGFDAPAKSIFEMYVFLNGTSYRRLHYDVSSEPGIRTMSMSGTAALYMQAGEYVEIFTRCGASVALSLHADLNFEVIKIA